MELIEMPAWQWISAIWITTWFVVIFRTWSRVSWLLGAMFPRHSMLERPILHMIVYILSINVILPIIGVPIVLYDESRDKWVDAYVNALGKKK